MSMGIVLDTNQGFISVTEHRITKLKRSIGSVLKGGRTTDVTKIMTRSLYTVVNTKVPWNSTVELSKEGYAELMFWNQNVDSLNCHSPIWECVKRRGHLLLLCESPRIFGNSYVTMVDIGTRLFTIGLYFRNLSNFL